MIMENDKKIEELKEMIQVVAFDHAQTKEMLQQIVKTFFMIEKSHDEMYKLLMTHDKIIKSRNSE